MGRIRSTGEEDNLLSDGGSKGVRRAGLRICRAPTTNYKRLVIDSSATASIDSDCYVVCRDRMLIFDSDTTAKLKLFYLLMHGRRYLQTSLLCLKI